MAAIDYYVFASSPFAYLGHTLFHDIAARHGLEIVHKPIDIMGVWANSGSVPPSQRSGTRQRYRRIELKRIAHFRGLPLNVDPKFFPVDPTLANMCAIALVEAGRDPAGFLLRAHRCVWADERDLGDRDTVAEFLAAEGHDASEIIARAEDGGCTRILAQNTADAVAADAIGAPVYVYRGEPFWGQDRLEMLEHMIVTGRDPATA